ncbi:MAG TPA: hypothetical protein ENH23_08110 [candidate division Zixibacteria bacterium]|nr:hypothetical protein [candidate division Zixibacteria bacterium]
MKSSIRMFTVVAVLTLGLASFGVAQMMSGNHEHSSTDKADSQSQSGMMNMGKMGMMKDMSNNFDKLKTHFDSMMQIDDINTLKAEMKKHQEMLQTMRDNMSEHQTMCMNMMNSDGKMDGKMEKMGCGMMGQGNRSTTN